MNSLLPACVILGLYSACTAGFIFVRNRSVQLLRTSKTPAWRFPLATFLLAAAVALPTTLQFFFPAILLAFRRDYTRFLSGEWWRLITPLFVQDGGVAGAVFNLVSLLLVGGIAEQLWGSKRMYPRRSPSLHLNQDLAIRGLSDILGGMGDRYPSEIRHQFLSLQLE